MDDLRIGQVVRSERKRRALRQSDLAHLAGVSPQTVLTVEHGRLEGLTVRSVRSVATAVGIQLSFVPRSVRGAALERQIDWRHAALVERVVVILVGQGWEVEPEWSFNHFGDRGCVDVLAWQPHARALLVIEVKSDLRDVQETLRALDVKHRVVPLLLRASRGWRPASIGVAMVLADVRAERDRIGRHSATFVAALPARTIEVKRWLCRPEGSLRGIWFLQIPRRAVPAQRVPGGERVRRPNEVSRRAAAAESWAGRRPRRV